MQYLTMQSPVGPLLLAGTESTLRLIGFATGSMAQVAQPSWTCVPTAFGAVQAQLKEYFEGQRRTFDLALEPLGTDFQQAVWQALLAIPYGETRSYLDIAKAIGKPKAVRAVGSANGRNPLPIVVPCHRVIGSDGSLTGFGGGLENKKRLLALEQSQASLFSGNG